MPSDTMPALDDDNVCPSTIRRPLEDTDTVEPSIVPPSPPGISIVASSIDLLAEAVDIDTVLVEIRVSSGPDMVDDTGFGICVKGIAWAYTNRDDFPTVITRPERVNPVPPGIMVWSAIATAC